VTPLRDQSSVKFAGLSVRRFSPALATRRFEFLDGRWDWTAPGMDWLPVEGDGLLRWLPRDVGCQAVVGLQV
jgi:hypothetical protein